MSRGFFITLDGLDGCGKSTQCRLLADWLRGRGEGEGETVTECADPGGTPIGDAIRGLLLDRRREMTLLTEAFLFMASRAQLTSTIIRPTLDAGGIVVADRYLLANVVYQGHAGGLDPELLWRMGRIATEGLLPNLAIVLDLSLERAQSRRNRPADRMESRDLDFHARVRAGFLREAELHPESIRVLDADRPVDVIQEDIRREVTRGLGQHPRT